MTTDVSVQYFSHLNGLKLENKWGDLIRLLDTVLVNGLELPSITAALINESGEVALTLYSDHKALLFQIVELSGFTPAALNQKYRIKGIPSTNQLILKPQNPIAGSSVNTSGLAKLSSFGYEIVFRDSGDVKRVYRAKNPTSKHPFIRVDESISDGVNSYASTYAKSAMVGLLERMDHIDDFNNNNVLQLPFDPADPAKNWKIAGTGNSVIRGWSRWVWTRAGAYTNSGADSYPPSEGLIAFTISGDKDAFYFVRAVLSNAGHYKGVYGCGIVESQLQDDLIPPWFLMTFLQYIPASTGYLLTSAPGSAAPFFNTKEASKLYMPKYNPLNIYQEHSSVYSAVPDYESGYSDLFGADVMPAISVPLYDDLGHLRGSLKHIHYTGKSLANTTNTTAHLDGDSMFVTDRCYASRSSNVGGVAFYLGELN